MFVIGALPPQPTAALRERLAQADPTNIGHFRDTGFPDPAIRAMQPDRRMAGVVVTVQVLGEDATIISHALGQVRPGDVLVIDRGGDVRHSCFGGMLAYAAKLAGVAGVIVDGAMGDISEIRGYGLPVWCLGLSPRTLRRQGREGGFCVPVQCGGVAVNPGDFVVADETGIVFFTPAEAEEIIAQSLAMSAAEPARRARLDQGEKIPDMNGTSALIAGAKVRRI